MTERRFRFDWSWLAADYSFDRDLTDGGVAIEIEGNVFANSGSGKSRHTTGVGYSRDAVKYNEAALRNWLVLRYPSHVIRREPNYVLEQVARAWQIKMGMTMRPRGAWEAIEV
jgi:hypothetical protein